MSYINRLPLITFVQAPDITEITSYGLVKDDFTEQDLLENVRTEFAWVVTATCMSSTPARLKQLGFSPLTQMKNHYHTHAGQKYPLTFWWRRLRDKSLPVPVERTYWNRHKELGLSGSGCGFKFGTAPLGRITGVYHNYFSLIRVPKDSFPYGYEQYLTPYNFRKVADGELATFFVNGWSADEWTYDKEMDWLHEHECPQRFTLGLGHLDPLKV